MATHSNTDDKNTKSGINHIDKTPNRLSYDTDRLSAKLEDGVSDPTTVDRDYTANGKQQLLDKMEKDLKAEEGPLKNLIDGREDEKYDSPT